MLKWVLFVFYELRVGVGLFFKSFNVRGLFFLGVDGNILIISEGF